MKQFLRHIFLLLALFLATTNAWALRYSKAVVKSSPAEGGFVWVSDNANSTPTWDRTEDSDEQQDNWSISNETFTYYIWYKTNGDYSFKGWSENENQNTGSDITSFGVTATSDNNVSWKPATKTYYAIFATLQNTVNPSFTGNYYADHSYSSTLRLKHAHANNVKLEILGDDAGVFSLSESSFLSTQLENRDIVVYFKPTCQGTYTATLKITSDNGLSEITIPLSATAEINPTQFSCDLKNEYYAGTSIALADCYTKTDNRLPITFESSDPNVIQIKDGVITALKPGTATVTARQDATCAWTEVNYSIEITVLKRPLKMDYAYGETTTFYIGDQALLTDMFLLKDIEDKSITGVDVTYQSSNQSVLKIENNKIIAFGVGKATVTATTSGTDYYGAVEKTVTLEIKKHTPSFTLSSEVFYYNHNIQNANEYQDVIVSKCDIHTTEHIGNYYEREIAENISLEFATSDSDAAVLRLKDGTNNSLNLSTFNTEVGKVTFNVTQKGNDYWEEKTESFEVTLKPQNNRVPFTIDTREMRDIFVNKYQLPDNVNASWDEGIQLGDGGNGFESGDKIVILHFSGIPDKLSFSTTIKNALFDATEIKWYVKESGDGVTWSDEIWSSTTKEPPANNILLSPTSRYVMLCYSGNFGAVFHNVTVTQRIEYEAVNNVSDARTIDDDVLKFGTTQILNEHQSKQFILRYATPGYKVKLTTTDERFDVSPTEITTIGGDNFDYYQPITVTYKKDKAHTTTDESKVIIKDERGKPVEEILLIGTTEKIKQNIQWVDKYKVDYPTLQVSEIVTKAATAVVEPVLYKSSNEDIIDVSEDKKSFQAIAPGEASITAYQDGNEKYAYAEISKVFYVTNKQVQRIEWDQSLIYLFVGDNPISLTAKVFVDDVEDEERTARLQYMSGDENVVTVSGNSLNIVGAGTTTLTVSVAADEEFEAAAMTIPVRVMNHSAGCDVVVGYTGTTATGKLTWNEQTGGNKDITIDVETGVPGKLSFTYRGVPFNIGGLWWLTGKISVSESADNVNWSPLKSDIYSADNQHNNDILVDGITLNRDTRYVRFTRYDDENTVKNQGTYVVNNIVITPAQFIEEQEDVLNEIDLGTIKVGSTLDTTYTISYSNLQTNPVLIYSNNSEIHIDEPNKNLEADCGAFGSQKKGFTFKPTQSGNFAGYIYVYDKNANCTTAIKVNAIVEKGIQQIIWEPKTTILSEPEDWRDDYTRNAYSNMGLTPITYSMESNEYAHFDENGNLVIDKKGGSVIITASQAGNDNFNAASVSKVFEIPIPTFIGGADDKLWTTELNWNIKRQPYETEEVIVKAEAEINQHIVAPEITFDAAGSIHITPQGGLTVGTGGIINAAAEGTSITIDNTPEGAGFLKLQPSVSRTATNTLPKVTINYTTAAYNSGNPRDEIWQYMGAPGTDMDILADEDKTLIYHWSEQNGWEKHPNDQLQPFAGYVFTQNKGTKENQEASFEISATPIIENTTINLTCTPNGMRGGNVFSNSYLAPIDVAKIDPDEDLEGVEGTFYLFNSGSWNDWQDQGGKDHMEYGVSPGQYYALSPKGASLMDQQYDQTTIPPMQGVYVVALNKEAKIELDYAKHVYNANASNIAMRAPQRQDDNFKRVRLQVSGKNSGADRMYVIQYDQATQGYDYGYDAKNIAAEDQVNIYTTEKDGQMEISVSDRMDSTYIGLQAGSDSEYRLRITSVIGEQLYLKDLENETLITVADGEEYVFYATPNSVNNRRFLLMDRLASEEIEDLVKVYIHDNVVHVLEAPAYSDMAVYTVGGVMMARYKLGESPCTVELSGLPTGVYLVRVADKAVKFVCK